MRITVVTPLFPPDIGAPAPYVKELAERLSIPGLTVLCYGKLPEAMPGVTVTTVKRRHSALRRFYAFTRALFRASRQSDVLYVQNGLSVELPALLVSFFTRTPIVFTDSDPLAAEAAKESWLRYGVNALLIARSTAVVRMDNEEASFPEAAPEILPFSPHPSEALEAHERTWERHVTYIRNIFSYVTT